ncbi:MAG: hypothetical protein QG608_482 [Actinomycetota bacterium]|nr:hypothetical protein [Actinomycetota bacterium]
MNALPQNSQPPRSSHCSCPPPSKPVSAASGPGSLWDTASLISLVCSRAAVKHVRGRGTLRDPGWASAIPSELRRLHSLDPPTAHAGQAHRLAVSWLGDPIRELPEEIDTIWDLRDRIAAGTGHPDEHLGEAQSIVVARRLDAVLISEDAGARAEARVEKVRALSLYGMLGVHLQRGLLTPEVAATIVADLHGSGRGPRQVSLHLRSLIATGHVMTE